MDFFYLFHIPSFVLYNIILIVPMITSLYFSLLKWMALLSRTLSDG